MDIVPFILKWEGGLSNDKADSASANPCPTSHDGHTGYHTNKGVTYAVWAHYFGKNNDSRFFTMSDEDWGVIFKAGYWDKVKGDLIESQAIANCMVSWAWGSGAARAIKLIQEVVGVDIDGKLGQQTIGAINSMDEVELFDKCIARRKRFFEDIAKARPANLKFLKGWMNRLNDFNKTFHP